jgi:agmatine/peptidylarginine deiminase
MTLRTVLPLAALALASTASLAQELGLPHTLAPGELPLIRPYRDSRASAARGITTPPPFAVRTMAEWEEVQSVVVTWTSYSGILKQIVRAARTECEVIIVCDNAATVQAYLQNNSYGGPLEDLSNIVYLEEDFNSVWVRDFGPESIYANEVDSLLLLDWIYNRPRPADDALSDALGAYKGVGVYSTTQAPNDLVHTGGNFMSDGFGTAFSSELVLEENGPNGEFNQTVRNEAGVDAMMQSFMGIQEGRYVKMQRLLYDNINHIDMHMKLLDEETLLVGEFPLGLSDGPRIEANVQGILDNVPSVFDDPYRTVRVPMPSSTGGNFPPDASYRTYANNVFINGTVLVPTYRTEYDSTGLRILRESLPGYNVVGIDCDNSDQNIISASGAIHCITKTIGVADPLLIRHQRLSDTYNTTEPYGVDAYIRHRSGIASAQVFWTTDTLAGYTTVPMVAQGSDVWAAQIPAQLAGAVVYYYIEATSNSGKVQVRPLVAPEGWWRFTVLDLSTGVDGAASELSAEVYPNPTSSLLMVTVKGAGRSATHIELLDATGRSVMVVHTGALHTDGRVFVDISSLPTGTYMLVVEGPGGRSTQRVMKL